MVRRTAGVSLLVAVLVGGCAEEIPAFEPAPRDMAIRVEEARIAPLIEKAERSGFSQSPGTCNVRVLAMREGTTYAWADCSWKPEGGGFSGPRRVDGTTVLAPGDGAAYVKAIRRDWPADIAKVVLEQPERLRPS